MLVGYIRVSSIDQKVDRQLEDVVVDKQFIEYASGATKERPKLQEMLSYVRENDHIYVDSIDRLARSLIDLRKIIDFLLEKNVQITFLKEKLLFGEKNSPHNTFLLNVIGAVSEFERAIIKERQLEGIKIAKAKGAYKGRPKEITDDQINSIKEMYKLNVSISKIAKKFDISQASVGIFVREIAGRRKKIEKDIKDQMFFEFNNGTSLKDLSLKYDLGYSTVCNIVKSMKNVRSD